MDFKPDPFDFSLAKRNFALKEAGLVTQPMVRKSGTTLVAAIYKDGVVMGADSRTTMGNVICGKNCIKVHKLTESIFACGAGTSADIDHVVGIVEAYMMLLELNSGQPAMVANAVRIAKQHLAYYQGLISAYLIIGGHDYKGSHLYEVSAHGSSRIVPYLADGSGSYLATTTLEEGFKMGMTKSECRELVVRALLAGMHGDNMSGNSYNLVIIDKEGARREGSFIPDFIKTEEAFLKYRIKPGATKIISKTGEMEKSNANMTMQ